MHAFQQARGACRTALTGSLGKRVCPDLGHTSGRAHIGLQQNVHGSQLQLGIPHPVRPMGPARSTLRVEEILPA